MRSLRPIAVLPTLFTLGNLVCGFFAIVVASRVAAPAESALAAPTDARDLMTSAWLIFLAMVFDALDGYVARLSRTSSDFGAQLDSLCDLVTFGVAPAFLLVKMCPSFALQHREEVWAIAAAFAACAALRLARFTIETGDEDEHLHFSGLPSPAAAAAVAGFAIMFHTLRRPDNPPPYAHEIDAVLQSVLPLFAVLVAVLMVSRVPYPHIVNQVFRGHRSFGHVVAVLFALAALMAVRGYAVPIVCVAFVFYGPARLAWNRVLSRGKEREEPLF